MLTSSRPSDVWTLAVLELLVGMACFAAAFAPATMHQFYSSGIILGSFFIATAAIVWSVNEKLGHLGLLLGSIASVTVLSGVVADAPRGQGAILASFAYIWMAVYAASFFGRRYVYLVLVMIATGSALGLAANGLHRWFGVWVLVTLTTTTTGIVLERSVGKLRREADTDALTGLLNRRGFFKAAALECSLADRAGLEIAIVAIDLDNFKEVNDRQGHAAGDELLVEATSAWRARVRFGDLLARFGGDEFVLLLTGASHEEVIGVVERCRAAHPIKWTAGSAILERGEAVESCIQRADQALYETKMRRLRGEHRTLPTPSSVPIHSRELLILP